MLGVFLLPAFTCLGHKSQDLLSLCDGMYVCTDYTLVYTLIRKSFLGGNGVRTYVNSKGKILSTGSAAATTTTLLLLLPLQQLQLLQLLLLLQILLLLLLLLLLQLLLQLVVFESS